MTVHVSDSPARKLADVCMSRFPVRLRQAIARSRPGTINAAARLAGINNSTMVLLTKGKRLPTAETLSRISWGLGVSADWLLGFDVAMDGTPLPGGRLIPTARRAGGAPSRARACERGSMGAREPQNLPESKDRGTR